MKAFSPLNDFLASEEAQGDLEKFLTQTIGGSLFLPAMRYWALHQRGDTPGNFQDGARAACDMIVVLTHSGQTEIKTNPDGSLKGAEKPEDDKRPQVRKKELMRQPPKPPASRAKLDEERMASRFPPVVGPNPPKS